MIATVLFLASAVIPAPAPPAEEEIVVIADRLKGWSGKVRDTLGIRSCRTTRSTGDKEIDAIGCRVLTDCFLPMKKRLIAAVKAAGRDAERRKAAMEPLNAEIATCANERRMKLISDLLDRRVAAENAL